MTSRFDVYIFNNLYLIIEDKIQFLQISIVYFDTTGKMVGAAATTSGISTSNYVLTTDASGIPKWTTTLDGGTF